MLKGKMKKLFTKLSLFGTAFLILFSFLSGAFITQDKNSVSAASVPAADIKDRVSNFTALYLLANNTCYLKDSISVVDATSNNIGYDDGAGTVGGTESASGYSFDGSNHQWGCQDILGSVGVASLWENAAGYSGNTIGFLKAIGYSCSGNPVVCSISNGYDNSDNSTIVSKLVALLKASNPNLMEGINVSGTNVTPSTAIKYAAWFGAFTASSSNGGCGAAFVSKYDKASPNDQAAALSGNDGSGDTYAINSVNADGSVSLNIYRGKDAGNTVGVINGVGSVNANKADCHEVADVLFESTDSKNGNWTSSPSMKNSSDSWAQAFATVVKSGDKSAQTIVVNGNSQSGSVSSSPYDKCFINIPVIGWLMCGMLSIADQFYNWIQGVIGDYLLMRGSPNSPNPLSSNQPLYRGWAAIKNISSVLILLVGLFMILSQVFSFEFMSAYTVKKVLPRLLVATIAIQFSWDIFTGLIYLVDALGSGVQSLLVSPFAQLVPSATNGNTIGLNSILGISGSGAANGGIFAGLLVLGGFATFAGGFIGMAIAAVGVIVTCFIIYFTLIIRYILIVALLVLSPIALVMWVLPGTQSLWKNWWSNYSKLLFMYPMIMLLFSAGSIGAYIISTSGVAYAQFAAIVAYFGPLFLIPATFKYAGSAMAAASGGVSKLGGMVKEKNPVSKSLGKGDQVRQQTKDTNAKLNSLSDNKFRRARGRFSTGVYGATGQAKEIMEANEEAEAIKQQSLRMNESIKGMDYLDTKDAEGNVIGLGQQSRVRAIAMDASKSKSERLAATQWLAQKGDSVGLRQTEEAMIQQGSEGNTLWNRTKDDNYSDISAIAPDLVGKSFESLNAKQMSTMKPETFKIMQNQVAKNETIMRDPASSSEDIEKATAQNASIRNTLTQLENSPTLSTDLNDVQKAALVEIVKPKGSLTAFSDIDHVGRGENEARYKNPSF